MTHSGGKPHDNVGDKGQRFEITYYDDDENVRKVFGWSDNEETVGKMIDSINFHPSMQFPQITDREAEFAAQESND